MARDVLAELQGLSRDLLAGDVTPADFAQRYQDAYPSLPELGEPRFAIVDRLFFVCEDFYDDLELRDPGDPDESDLRAAAARMLDELAAL